MKTKNSKRERAYAAIDLEQFSANYHYFRSIIHPATKLMAVVKADAYGHGAVALAKAACAHEVDYLGVAWFKEANELRAARIKTPILLFSEPTGVDLAEIIRLNITQTIYTLDFAKKLNATAKKLNQQACVHLKVDTGMGRIGVTKHEIFSFIKELQQLKNLTIEGIFSHLATADQTNDRYTQKQIATFTEITNNIDYVMPIPLKHLANTFGTLNYETSHFNMVRIGIGLYQNLLTFKTKISYIKKVPKNTSLSYGLTYQTKKATNIATLSVGYADGLVRLLSNSGRVLIRGKSYPIVGNICMDMTLVDLGEDFYPIAEEVTLIGRENEAEITVEEVAKLAATIDYEILCGIGKRVPRIYT